MNEWCNNLLVNLQYDTPKRVFIMYVNKNIKESKNQIKTIQSRPRQSLRLGVDGGRFSILWNTLSDKGISVFRITQLRNKILSIIKYESLMDTNPLIILSP